MKHSILMVFISSPEYTNGLKDMSITQWSWWVMMVVFNTTASETQHAIASCD